jgi:hypothetical protein
MNKPAPTNSAHFVGDPVTTRPAEEHTGGDDSYKSPERPGGPGGAGGFRANSQRVHLGPSCADPCPSRLRASFAEVFSGLAVRPLGDPLCPPAAWRSTDVAAWVRWSRRFAYLAQQPWVYQAATIF